MMPRKAKFILIGSPVAIGGLNAIAWIVKLNVAPPGIVVVVKNSDASPITSVQVSVGGKVLNLGTIASGASANGIAGPIADSDVRVRYVDASGTPQFVIVDTYVTGGYRGRVEAEVRGGSLLSSHDEFN
jgi:hypothetical protein